MLTIIEPPTFEADAKQIWTEDERNTFFTWLASNSEFGDPIPGSRRVEKGSLVGSRFREAWWGAFFREVLENE